MRRWSFNKIMLDLQYIKNSLENNTKPNINCYYIGGSLAIDYEKSTGYSNVVLNRNGKGFFYGASIDTEIKFIMTNEMQKLVLEIYEICKIKRRKNEQK